MDALDDHALACVLTAAAWPPVLAVCRRWHDVALHGAPHVRRAIIAEPRGDVSAWLAALVRISHATDDSSCVPDVLDAVVRKAAVAAPSFVAPLQPPSDGGVDTNGAAAAAEGQDLSDLPALTRIALICVAARADSVEPVRALLPALTEWILERPWARQHYARALYHSAAWAVGAHGARVLHCLWAHPLRHWLARPQHELDTHAMRHAALMLMDVALIGVEQARGGGFFGPGAEAAPPCARVIADTKWVIEHFGHRYSESHSEDAPLWARIWNTAPETVRALLSAGQSCCSRKTRRGLLRAAPRPGP